MQDLTHCLREFAEQRNWQKYHSPKNLAMALIVEVAEIVEHFQWLTEEQSCHLDTEKLSQVSEEIGDVLLYLVRMADILKIDPLAAAREKLQKNIHRFPVENS